MSETVNVGTNERWVSSVAGGALLALGLRGGQYRSPLGIGLLLTAGHLLYRGVRGRDHIYRSLGIDTAGDGAGEHTESGIKVAERVTINKSPEELYQFWRNFENLPQFMDHLESVQARGDRRSHWVAKAPAGQTVAWDAEIVDDRPNEFIAWRSLPGSDISNAGSVRFRPGPEGRGTEVDVRLEYSPPGGLLGVGIAKLFGEEPGQQVAGDLRRFKNLIETGEVPTTEGQSQGPT